MWHTTGSLVGLVLMKKLIVKKRQEKLLKNSESVIMIKTIMSNYVASPNKQVTNVRGDNKNVKLYNIMGFPTRMYNRFVLPIELLDYVLK